MGKLFGTDGIRGIAGESLTATLAFQVGFSAAVITAKEKKNGRPVFTIGKDTRISSDMLEAAVTAGLCAAGADVLALGVIPTPAVAYLTVETGADAGVVISASHNPYEYNGVKIFNRSGVKLPDRQEAEIEEMIAGGSAAPSATGDCVGRVIPYQAEGMEKYIAHLRSTVNADFAGLHILVDCANGATYKTAPILFGGFRGLKAEFISTKPDGMNINTGCGSTHIDLLSEKVRSGNFDIGLAFDGDADRCLAVDERGTLIDGDQVLAVAGTLLAAKGELSGNTVVGTVMTNLGLRTYAAEHGMTLLLTDVGDRNVLERMEETGAVLGGEQSGHTIFRAYATTGDGELTALQLLSALVCSRGKASQLVEDCPRYPQVLLNVPVGTSRQKECIMGSEALNQAKKEAERRLGGEGRILIRPSGTEALLRVMVEAKEEKTAQREAEYLAAVMKSIL